MTSWYQGWGPGGCRHRLRPLDSSVALEQDGHVTDHPHAHAYLRAKAALESGDVDGFLAWLAPDVAWWDVGSTEPIVGRAKFAAQLRDVGSVSVVEEIHDLLANDEHLVALIHAQVEHAGEAFSLSWAEVHHFDDAGRVTKRQAFPSDIAKAVTVAQWRRGLRPH